MQLIISLLKFNNNTNNYNNNDNVGEIQFFSSFQKGLVREFDNYGVS